MPAMMPFTFGTSNCILREKEKKMKDDRAIARLRESRRRISARLGHEAGKSVKYYIEFAEEVPGEARQRERGGLAAQLTRPPAQYQGCGSAEPC